MTILNKSINFIHYYLHPLFKMSYNILFDFGGVLSVHDGGNTEHKNTCINMPNAKESIEQMKNNGHNLSIVSFCGRSRANETFPV